MSFRIPDHRERPDRIKPVQQPEGKVEHGVDACSRSRCPSEASSVATFHSAHFPPEEEARLLAASNELKTIANAQFAAQDYSSALSTYDKAVAECPNYLNYELAVLSSNIAACHLRLEDWKSALQAAEQGMEGLDIISPAPKSDNTVEDGKVPAFSTVSTKEQESQVVELPDGTSDAADLQMLRDLQISDERRANVHRIRTKLLLRRARARYMLGTVPPAKSDAESSKDSKSSLTASAWSHLSAAQNDYQTLSCPPYFASLPPSDKRTVTTAMQALQPLVEQAKEREVKEMMGKLKELGNGILKPFGLSTDMFKMERDEKSGGMSLKFGGGASN